MRMEQMYQDVILDHYKHPHGRGLREPFGAEVHHVNPTCGDEVTLRVHLDGTGPDAHITDISYEAMGCSISMASTSILAEEVVGHPLSEALTTYVSRSAEKLRRQRLAAAAVSVLVSTNRHKSEEPQHHATRHVRLTIATADTGRLIRAALYGLRGIYRPGFRYKKTGILLLDLIPAAGVQGSLFLQPDDPRRLALMGAIDGINQRYGRDRVRFAGTGLERGWKLKAEFHSPRYTTRWDELLRV